MSQYYHCGILEGAHNGEKYGNFVEIAVLQQKLFLYLSETTKKKKKLNSIAIIVFTQVMNNIGSDSMGTKNKV